MGNAKNISTLALGLGLACGAGLAAAAACLVDVGLNPKNTVVATRVARQTALNGGLVMPAESPDVRNRLIFNIAWLDESVEAWKEDVAIEKTCILADAGQVSLTGYLYHAPEPSRQWVVLAHGYRLSHRDMEPYALIYALRGFNVLIPDLRGHGESSAPFIGMGWLDAADICEWADYLIGRFGTDISLVLHGCSMGGSAVLAATGAMLPAQVKAVIADSAFSSVYEIAAHNVRRAVHLPAQPLLACANGVLRARGGYNLRDGSIMGAVKNSHVPTLLIHGAQDSVVPPSMASLLYRHCAAPVKELRVVPRAQHTMSYLLDPEDYAEGVFSFLARVGAAR